MAGIFDPYQAWLGIPPEEQPPSLYRLLGLSPLESDLAAIERAAEARLGQLRAHQTGEQADYAKRLMADVTAAMACLLNPAKKAAYDRQLRQVLQPFGNGPAQAGGQAVATDVTATFDEQGGVLPPSIPAPLAGGTPPPSPGAVAPELGQLGEYQLLEKLGQGGMGTVYKALHTKLGRTVALKVLSKDRVWDERAIVRFEREMKAVGAVDHPHIVRAMDAREIGETRILVMEFVDGLDLAEIVKRCYPLAIADACELVRQAALALEGVHAYGLVHRDVKPSNLMLTRQGQVKLLDLGLARFEMDPAGGDEVTGAGQAIGTVEYMAPEQLSDSTSVDIRADLYSLGCTLFKFLAGQTPFGGPEYKGPLERLMAHVQKPVPSVWQYRGDVPPALVHVVERMLAKDPNQRFQTPVEVAQALTPLAEGCDLAALLARAEGGPAATAAPPIQTGRPTEEASSTLTRFIRNVASEHQSSTTEDLPIGPPPWAKAVIYLASAAIVVLFLAIASVLGYRAYQASSGEPVMVLDWPEEQRDQVLLQVDGQLTAFPESGALEIPCRAGRHKLAATRPGFKPWTEEVTLSPGQRRKIDAGWLPQTYLIVHWPAAERRGVTMEIDGRPIDLAKLGNLDRGQELRVPLDAGPHRLKIARPGFAPVDEQFKIVEGESAVLQLAWEPLSARHPAPAAPPVAPRPPAPAVASPVPAVAPAQPAPRAAAPGPLAAEVDNLLQQHQQRSTRWAEVLAPIEKLVVAWDFQRAVDELDKLDPKDRDLAARLAVRREGLQGLTTLKDRAIAKINAADPPLKKSDLMLRGLSGEVVKADPQGLEARLANDKLERYPWSGLNEKSRSKVLQLAVDRKRGDDWIAAGALAAAFDDTELAEKCFEQARGQGMDVKGHLGLLAGDSLDRACRLLDKGQYEEAGQRLDEIEGKYAALPWFTAEKKVFEAARAKTRTAACEAEAENVYTQAAQFYRNQEWFDLRPLVDALTGQYGQTQVVQGGGRSPSLAEMAEAVAPLGKVFSVRSDGKGDYQKIQQAIDAAPSGSLIEILDAGPYNETIRIPSEKTGLTIRGKRGCWPVISSLGALKDLPILVAVEGRSTTLQRLILVHATPVGQTPHCLAIQASQARLRSCLVSMEVGNQALWTAPGTQSRFEDCVILASGTTGGSDVFQNCLLVGQAFQWNVACELRGSTMTHRLALGSPPSVLLDSIVSEIRNDQLHRIDHCDVYGMAPPPGSRDCFSADPQFRNPHDLDYQLGPSSPCLKKASDGGDLGCRLTAEMRELCKQALELRRKGWVKF
jgi:serine/threonine protein kinase